MKRYALWTAVLFILALMMACTGGESEPETVTVDEADESTASNPTSAPDPTPTEEVVAVNLENLGPAPEIENEVWLNTDQPIPLSSVEGKVVLLEFWTFG